MNLICHFVLWLHEFFGREFLNDPFERCLHLDAEKYINTFTLSHGQRNRRHLFLLLKCMKIFLQPKGRCHFFPLPSTFFSLVFNPPPKGHWCLGTSVVVMTGGVGAGMLFHPSPGPGGPTDLLLTDLLVDTCSLAKVPRGQTPCPKRMHLQWGVVAPQMANNQQELLIFSINGLKIA